MPKAPTFYELSLAADQDLSAIFDYTETEFGLNQAARYLGDLDQCFARLVENPGIGKARTEIRPELYSIVTGSQIVFYRVLSDRIRIVRILHGSCDLPRHFQDGER